jgi:O-antigen/teichoic acid export membrane protein
MNQPIPPFGGLKTALTSPPWGLIRMAGRFRSLAPERGLFWMRKGTATIFDQGLVSGSNFLLTVILARWLGPAQFGAYVMIFSVFLLLANVHQAVLIEPLSVLEPSLYPGKRSHYLGSVICLHVLLCSGISVLLLVAAAITSRMDYAAVAGALAGLALAMPCILLLWLARSGLYLGCEPARAAVASLVYCIVMMAGLVTVYRLRLLSPFSTFCLMGMSSLVAASVLLHRLKPHFQADRSPGIREVWRSHWDYGRWSLAGVAVQWLVINGWYLLTGSLLGMKEAGCLGALSAFLQPLNHTMAALSRLAQPRLASIAARNGPRALKSPVFRLALLFTSGAAIYWSAISLFRAPVMNFVYGNKYMEFAHFVPAATVMGVFAATTVPSELGLRALLRPSALFRVGCISSVLTITFGPIALWRLGLPGVFLTTISASIVNMALTSIVFRRNVEEAAAIGSEQNVNAQV